MARMATVQIVQSSVYVFRVYQLGIRTMEQVVRNTRLNNVSVACPSGSADPYSIRIFFVYFGKLSFYQGPYLLLERIIHERNHLCNDRGIPVELF